jgi:hypothetical protein
VLPVDHLQAVHRRLLTEFSRAHLPDEVVRSPQAVARYIAETFDLSEVVEWPEDVLLAAWRLGGKRFHYSRSTAAGFFHCRVHSLPRQNLRLKLRHAP